MMMMTMMRTTTTVPDDSTIDNIYNLAIVSIISYRSACFMRKLELLGQLAQRISLAISTVSRKRMPNATVSRWGLNKFTPRTML